MIAARVLIAAAGLAGYVTLAACGEDDDARCVRELCDPATHGAVCVGHAVQTCAADGKRFVYDACSSQQRCSAGACVARACTALGEASCSTVTEIERCAADGSGFETIACASGQTCRDGACVPTACPGQDDFCTTHGFLACINGEWAQSNCPPTQLCVLNDSGAARCAEKQCTPEVRSCEGRSVSVCDGRGAVAAILACAAAEVCVAGVCQREVCGGSDADVVDASDVADTSDTAPEPESKILFSLPTGAVELDQSASASFDGGDRRVTLQASRASRRIEVRFNPASVLVSGNFDSTVFNPIKVVICYDDGGTPESFADCDGFTHHAVAYTVSVTQNDGPGGRFVATFEATLEDVNTDQTPLTSGQINVKFR